MPLLPELHLRRHRPDSPWTYARLLEAQDAVRARLVADAASPGACFLSELAPVITLGRRAGFEREIWAQPGELAARGIEVLSTGRGGLATYHGPGQWVLFVVDRLERLTGDSRGVRRAVEGLLAIALEVSRRYDPSAEIREGIATGVWGARGKIASVGVQIEDGVLLHGLCVNGYATPESFYGLHPCGMPGAAVQYLLGETSPCAAREADFLELGDQLIRTAKQRFYPS